MLLPVGKFSKRAVVALAAASLIFLVACDSPPAPIAGPVEGNSFAIEHVRVFDGTETTEDATIVVRGGLIAAVGTEVVPPTDLPLVDGTGKTLIPGLIDAHTHTGRDAALSDALRFGVTTQLEMMQPAEFAERRRPQRDKLDRTELADVWSAGWGATPPGGHGTQFWGGAAPTLASPQEAEAFVRARVDEGSDFIKIIYGQSGSGSNERPSISRETLVPLEESLVAMMAAQDTFVVATLSLILHLGSAERTWREVADDPRVDPFLSDRQREGLLRIETNPPVVRYQVDPSVLRASLARRHQAGVDVLAGTDADAAGTVHGASLHGELVQLVNAGLTPAEALAAATRLPAERFGLNDRGRVASGLRADLVLVDGDPTTDITATRAIARIFKNGYEVDRVAVMPSPPAPQATAPPATDPLQQRN